MFRLGVSRSTAVTAEDVLKVIRRATRNAKDELLGVVVRKLGEDAVYLYDKLYVDRNGRPKRFSVWELYETYLNHPQRLFQDAALVGEVNKLYWYGKDDPPSRHAPTEWYRTVLWPKFSDEERLQLQAVSDFITSRYYGFRWYPENKKDETRYNYHAMSVLCALVWPLVEREKKWQRKYRVADEPVAESVPVQPILLLESGEKPSSADEPDCKEVDPLPVRKQRMQSSWKKK